MDKYLFRQQLRDRVGLSFPTIYRLIKAGRFPKQRQLSPGRVAWLESEVNDWIASREQVGG